MRILFIGDIIGRPGRDIVASVLPRLTEEYEIDL
ncbi:MAG: Metallo-phosphoesterase, partial [candidate division NC10 bacterium]|nr:Metallo-phosphoesterase [candidate division NC10 bacterium]